MHVLFVHRSGSGQFAHLIERLVRTGADVTLVTGRAESQGAGVRQVVYAAGEAATAHLTLAATDFHIRTGEAVAAVLQRLAGNDRPDMIVGHTGWGGLLFAKDAMPDVPVLGYCEYYYNARNSDFDFDQSSAPDMAERMRLRMRNAAQLVTLQAIDAAYTPTRWQHRQYPRAVRERIAICHDGIDTQLCRPDPGATFTLPDGRTLRSGDPVVTFVARDLDPYRGYPQFMRAAARLARRRPDTRFVVVGGDGDGYGKARADGRLWREVMLEETGLGERVVHIPWLAHAALIRLFQVSAAHAYLSVPFVLSWSLLEAMACGCLVVGSRTAPVQEVVADRRNGLLAPFQDEQIFAEALDEALERQRDFAGLREAARATVLTRFEREACLDRQLGFIDRLAAHSALGLAAE
jgi:glycosyltransferase involved in cell wall biosynthesis